MGRKYGAGGYGADTYDLDASHPKVLFDGDIVVPVTMNGADLTSFRKLMGSMIIPITMSGSARVTFSIAGNVFFEVKMSALTPLIGERWEPNIPNDWCDVPEYWTPTTIADIPCKVPL